MPTLMHSYFYSNTITLLKTVKVKIKFQSIANLKIYQNVPVLSSSQLACQPVSQLAVRCMALEFNTAKIIMSDLRNCCSDEGLSTAPWCFLLFLAFVFKLLTER